MGQSSRIMVALAISIAAVGYFFQTSYMIGDLLQKSIGKTSSEGRTESDDLAGRGSSMRRIAPENTTSSLRITFSSDMAPNGLDRSNPNSTTTGIMNTVDSKKKTGVMSHHENAVKERDLIQTRARQYLANENRPHPPKDLTMGAFIHMYKTGGSTLSQLLTYGCHSFAMSYCKQKINSKAFRTNETAVSKLTTYYHTPDFNSKKNGLFGEKGAQHDFYLFTIRDPLDHIISGFLYQHPLNVMTEAFHEFKKTERYSKIMADVNVTLDESEYEKGAYNEFLKDVANINGRGNARFRMIMKRANSANKTILTMQRANRANETSPSIFYCAPTLEDFATMLDSSIGDTTTSGNCSRLAKNIMDLRNSKIHTETCPSIALSLTYVTSNLSGASLTNKTILSVRTEHLNNDWILANEYLGQKEGTVVVPMKNLRDSSLLDRPVTKEQLSEAGRRKLCNLLQKEYSVYLSMLRQAANIPTGEFEKSFALARKNCPW
eukprot:CAMPEP_0181117748 /NCGR_PEP_ID=MMETSP1071-20121207/22699_1 /TAXON_ID=35127 /ORGANISM="Thalassiosira sp., Strain NH16" /LENGTH=490 /DNA_ID=CAMNT_0023202179 /DNA_START=338 /DNA_END=1807 /DNA_ORIENTATION=+